MNKNDLFSQHWSATTIKKVVAHYWLRLPLLFKKKTCLQLRINLALYNQFLRHDAPCFSKLSFAKPVKRLLTYLSQPFLERPTLERCRSSTLLDSGFSYGI